MSKVSKPKILIVGDFSFSRGEAGSNYVIGLGKAIEGAGFRVEYLGEDLDRGTVREDFREFTCHLVQNRRARTGWRATICGLTASDDGLIKWLEQTPAGEFSAVIAYVGSGSTVGFLVRLHRLCLRKGFKLMVVVGEWQRLSQFGSSKLRRLVMATVDSEIQRRLVNKTITHVIAISRFLERYYRNSGCQVIRIPPLVDAQARKWDCRETPTRGGSFVKLLFSGGWQRDRLDLITEAVVRLRNEGHAMVLEFLGCGPEDLESNAGLRSQIRKAPAGTFRFHGRVPVEQVLPITASADFGLMLRDRAKWSEACFPSKVAELQALGVPLLCNLTSDLDEQLRDGENALVVPQVSVAAFVATVKRALALTPSERQRMKQFSLQCAATQFDYRHYSDSLGEFIRHSQVVDIPVTRTSAPRQLHIPSRPA